MNNDGSNPLEHIERAAFEYARAQRLLVYAKPTLKRDSFVAMQERVNGLKKALDRITSETSVVSDMKYSVVHRAILAAKAAGFEAAEKQRAAARNEGETNGCNR